MKYVDTGPIIGELPREQINHILRILEDHGGKMKRSRLRASTGMQYAYLNPILGELAREGRIRISGDIITLERVI